MGREPRRWSWTARTISSRSGFRSRRTLATHPSDAHRPGWLAQALQAPRGVAASSRHVQRAKRASHGRDAQHARALQHPRDVDHRSASHARRVLGRYRLEARLARGGMAEVWRARDERSGRRVAVKLLHPHLLPDQASRARLASEARAVGGLDHPGIIRVLAADAGERPAVVLDLVEGEPLSARLERDGPLDPRTAAEIGAEVAEALYHAHTRGVIHRDVK